MLKVCVCVCACVGVYVKECVHVYIFMYVSYVGHALKQLVEAPRYKLGGRGFDFSFV